MNHSDDSWYVRLPNGQTAHAPDLDSLRHHFEEGTIPPESLVRKRGSKEWLPIIRVIPIERPRREDPMNGSGVSTRLGGMQLRTLGVRGVGQELLSALDNTLVPTKIILGCGFAMMTLFTGWAVQRITILTGIEAFYFSRLLTIAAELTVLAIGVTILTRITHRELSEMRSVSGGEAIVGMGVSFRRLCIAWAMVPGLALAILAMIPFLFGWLQLSENEILTSACQLILLFLAVGLWFVIGASLLIAPVLIVEEQGVRQGMRDWQQLLSDHWGHVVLYEAVAIALGLVASLPHLIPVQLALRSASVPNNDLGILAVEILSGFSFGPFLSYLAVANVFIYLNLRYEHGRD